MQPARQQQMAGLAAEERDRVGGVDGGAHDGAGVAVDAARQVDRDDRRRRCVHHVDHGARQALDRTVETGAEQGIDHEVPAAERFRQGRLDRPLPAGGRKRRIALEPAALAHEEKPHLVAALGQDARRHKAVAAVVARTGHHHSRAARQQAGGYVGHGAAGILHQVDAGRAACHGQPVGFAHFSRGQQLDHGRRDYRAPRHRQVRAPGDKLCKLPNCEAPNIRQIDRNSTRTRLSHCEIIGIDGFAAWHGTC